MNLTKVHIAKTIQTELGFSKKQSADVVESVLNTMKTALASGENILISGFGKFNVKDKRKRKGRNPVTGDEMVPASRKVVTLKCSGKLKARMNGR